MSARVEGAVVVLLTSLAKLLDAATNLLSDIAAEERKR